MFTVTSYRLSVFRNKIKQKINFDSRFNFLGKRGTGDGFPTYSGRDVGDVYECLAVGEGPLH